MLRQPTANKIDNDKMYYNIKARIAPMANPRYRRITEPSLHEIQFELSMSKLSGRCGTAFENHSLYPHMQLHNLLCSLCGQSTRNSPCFHIYFIRFPFDSALPSIPIYLTDEFKEWPI